MNYYQKYLKYKNKYLQLKQQRGGSTNSNTDSIYNFTPNTIYIYIDNQTGTIGRAQYIDTQNGIPRFNLNGNIVNMPLNQYLFFNNTPNPNQQLPRKLSPFEVGGFPDSILCVVLRNNSNQLRLMTFMDFRDMVEEYDDYSSSFYRREDLARIGINL
jgi:hypothetical protein